MGRLASIAEVARQMAGSGARVVVIVDEGRLWGIVTDRDLVVRAMARDLPTNLPVSWIATPDPVWADARDTGVNGYRRLREAGFRQVPVMGEGGCVGLLRLDDLLEAIPAERLARTVVAP